MKSRPPLSKCCFNRDGLQGKRMQFSLPIKILAFMIALKLFVEIRKKIGPIEPSPQYLVHSSFPIMVSSTVTFMEFSDGILYFLFQQTTQQDSS
jgi:hypothetical protein